MKVTYKIDLSLVFKKTIDEILGIDSQVRVAGGSKNYGIDQAVGIAAMYAAKELRKYRISLEGRKLQYEQFLHLRKRMGEEYIHIHRLNYMVYTVIQDMHDWMEDEGLKNFNTERYWKKIERTFSDYQKAHRQMTDSVAWSTVQDHVRLVYDAVSPKIEPLENAVRDFLIWKRPEMVAQGQKDDITLLT